MTKPSPILADSQFSTDSLKLAAFLLANGLPLMGSGYAVGSKLVYFFFEKTPRLAELELAFQNNTSIASIGIQNLYAAQDTLWEIVKKKRREERL